jgi:hypothetical protein
VKQFLSGLALSVILCGPYASAQQVTTKLPTATVKLNGAGGGGGDITAVDIATTAPITGGANCATGACSFTLGLTGGTLSGLTAGRILQATGATTAADSDLSYYVGKWHSGEPVNGRKLCFTDSAGSVTCLATTATGFVGQGFVITKGSAEGSAVGDLYSNYYRADGGFIAQGGLVTVGSAALYSSSYAGGVLPAITLQNGEEIGWGETPDTQIKRDAAGQVGIYGTTTTYGQLNVGSIQQSYSKALVDATATDVVQVPVASNSYEGFTMDYTIFATDATDYQVRQGSVPVAVLNVGGTETCVFGTATEAVNASAGTLTVAFDCTAGTNTVMVRANANTSLASTTIFTIQQRINLTSGTAVLVPQ